MNYTVYSHTERIVKGKVRSKKKKEIETDDFLEVQKTVKNLRIKEVFSIVVIDNLKNTTETYKLLRNNYFRTIKTTPSIKANL